LVLLGHADEQATVGLMAPIVAGIFLGITGALLVFDLKQPTRFYYLITKGNFTSWLVKGAYVLMAFAAVSGLWFIAGVVEADGLIEVLAIPAALTGLATAGYTAFLFAQCEGRDLWQTPLLLPMLLARAVTAGAAAWLIADVFMDVPEPDAIRWALLGGVSAVMVLSWMETVSHGSRHVELAVHSMVKGEHGSLFWGGLTLGCALPFVLAIVALTGSGAVALSALAGLAALVGMFLSETAFVRAGQSVPLS
ncbi:MAG: NrfD/PsrC family molybdoenzyme membrane anchor subunit, partial [Acidimicrobiia bacterium]